jgi:hypothetical protein
VKQLNFDVHGHDAQRFFAVVVLRVKSCWIKSGYTFSAKAKSAYFASKGKVHALSQTWSGSAKPLKDYP